MIDGTSRNRIEITNTEVVVNQSSVDSDFRVESNGDANMLFVDAGNDRVGIGTSSPSSALETVGGDGITISNSGDTFLQLKTTGTTATNYIEFKDSGGSAGNIVYNHTDNYLATKVNGSERMRIDSGGRVMIAETSNSGYSATADDLIVGDNGSSTERGISLGSTAGSTIRFNDGADAGLIEYAHSDNSMRLYTAATERLRIDSSGRVGIAQDTPGDFNAAADDLVIGNSGGDFGMTIRTGTSSNGSIHFADGTSGDAENEGIITYDHSDDHMHFSTSASERMRIDSSGNVGIGDNSPDSRLHLTTGSSAILRMQRSNNIFGFESGSTASGGYGLYDYAASAYDLYLKAGSIMVGTTTPVGKAHFSQSGLDSDVLQLTNSNSTRSFGQRITFSTDHNDTTSKFLVYKGNTTDRLVIYSNGNIQNTNNSYGALSDEKLKENIVDATDKLEDLKQVKIRNYNFIGEDKNQIGVIAQELETIFPSMVEDIQDQDAEGNLLETSTKSVKYSVFVPILIKAIQEQQTIIDDLKTRIETLEG
jgi:DNA-binding transcriptional regulator/RsmH inhibitor MraZ